MPRPPATGPLLLEPIGIARCAMHDKVQAARQPAASAGVAGTIELYPGRNFEDALGDLAGWEMIWVLFWFHRNRGWRPKVLPPRSTSGRKGVFATRAPHRPNPLGLSALTLERVDGLVLHVRGMDLVDGTPVLDIKPYVPYTDAYPQARSGWLEAEARQARGEAPGDPLSPWVVAFESLAAEQAGWIAAHTGLDIRARIESTLALGPQPHPYRRIRREGAGLRLAVGEWRVRFVVSGREAKVLAIASGYRPAQLAAARGSDALQPHREFVTLWPGAAPTL